MKTNTTGRQQPATQQMTLSNQQPEQQPYWVSNDATAGVGALPHGLSPAHCVPDEAIGANTVVVAPVCVLR